MTQIVKMTESEILERIKNEIYVLHKDNVKRVSVVTDSDECKPFMSVTFTQEEYINANHIKEIEKLTGTEFDFMRMSPFYKWNSKNAHRNTVTLFFNLNEGSLVN